MIRCHNLPQRNDAVFSKVTVEQEFTSLDELENAILDSVVLFNGVVDVIHRNNGCLVVSWRQNKSAIQSNVVIPYHLSL